MNGPPGCVMHTLLVGLDGNAATRQPTSFFHTPALDVRVGRLVCCARKFSGRTQQH
jgi:hypothetical protein